MKRFAIIGSNFITDLFLEAAAKIEGLELAAVYSRSAERAGSFARRYGAQKIYTDQEALAKDDTIDGIYIASPNSLHFEQTMRILKNRKHVLCEKPIASNLSEAKRMFAAAKEQRRVLLEGMRPVFDPGFRAIQENLHKLGKIRMARFHFCKYSSRYDDFKAGKTGNTFNPAFSNGALMDIGVYAVHALIRLFGMPQKLDAASLVLESSIDGIGSILLTYPEMLAVLSYSKITNGYLLNEIQGEDAVMLIDRIEDTQEIEILYRKGEREKIEIVKEENNMVYEAGLWLKLMEEEGGWEEALSIGKYSLQAMELMDGARRETNIVFPADIGCREECI